MKEENLLSGHLTSRCVINETFHLECQSDITNLLANICLSFHNKATCFNAYCAVDRQYINIWKDVLQNCYYILTFSSIGVRCQTLHHCLHSISITLNIFLTSLLYETESFLRSQPVLSKSRNSPHFMEPRRFITAFTCARHLPLS